MRFTLTFEMDNAAFNGPPSEAARILRRIADLVENDAISGRCRDINGNTVGYVEHRRLQSFGTETARSAVCRQRLTPPGHEQPGGVGSTQPLDNNKPGINPQLTLQPERQRTNEHRPTTYEVSVSNCFDATSPEARGAADGLLADRQRHQGGLPS